MSASLKVMAVPAAATPGAASTTSSTNTADAWSQRIRSPPRTLCSLLIIQPHLHRAVAVAHDHRPGCAVDHRQAGPRVSHVHNTRLAVHRQTGHAADALGHDSAPR